MTIRLATASDAPALSALSAELGYPVPEDVMADRMRHLEAGNDHAVFVAESDSRVIGWIDIGTVFHLQAGARGEIGGLVVAAGVRSQGVGRQLLARAEQWAKEKGIKKLVVRSNTKRADAHRFYLREKYTETKTQAVFEKKL